MRSRYFRVSVTGRCNLRCPFCHGEGHDGARQPELSAPDIVWAIEVAHRAGFEKFKLTGGEPTLRADLADIITGCANANLQDLSLITNGTTLVDVAPILWGAGLRRLNVSLQSFDTRKASPSGYAAAILRRTCRGIDKALGLGFRDMKINFVYRGQDSEPDFWSVAAFAAERKLTVVMLPEMAAPRSQRQNGTPSLQQLHDWLAPLAKGEPSMSADHEGIRRALYRLPDGITVLLRLDELGQLRPFRRCAVCPGISHCREGIFAIRLLANGALMPCLASGQRLTETRDQILNRDLEGFRNTLAGVSES